MAKVLPRATDIYVIAPAGTGYEVRLYGPMQSTGLHREKVLQLSTHLAGEMKSVLGPKHPIVSGSLHAFGQILRVQIVVPPAVEEGASLSIRKYVSRLLDVGEIGFLERRQVSVEGERRACQRQY